MSWIAAVVRNVDSPENRKFDFRSDVVTTPTLSMLQAIQQTTLLDDVYQEDTTTQELEAFIAKITNHEASLFVLSGTMGNQVAMRTHLGAPPHSIICDHRAHVALYEAGGAASLCGAYIKTLVPKNGHHLTLEDIQANAVLDDDVHGCPTKVISLENTINGTVIPLDECRRISKWAREHEIIVHLDGARLWEAVAAGAGSLLDYAACFNSMSLCFSKGLGAPIGSVLVGNRAFIKRARWVRKMFGGGLRQAGVVSSAARVAVEETFLGGQLKAGHEKAQKLGEYWEGLGGKLKEAVETNMVWIDIESMEIPTQTLISTAEKHSIRVSGGRFVIHYQISDEAIRRLQEVMKEIIIK
ncbi:l-allo-threonine aldolase [Microthyrium microscopicum]|uniref:L-allo-threonine aldolase n=1 Tax=Microthyrium microscopicum TaxID=703497 RepID=A0A6A6UWP0_9PEZI|nr:l-allo-threonine aldolase [Microthyrium microscopicum]